MELTSVIPVYNGLPFIQELLESFENQTRRPDRIVVLDNCSTDRTVEIVKQFANRLPIQLVQRPVNIGSLRNCNEALDVAPTTDLLHLVSHDDILERRFFERLIPLVAKQQGRALAFSRFVEIDHSGKVTRTPPCPSDTTPRQLSHRQFLIRQSELNHVYLQTAIFKTDRQAPPVYFRDGWLQAADVLFFAEHSKHCQVIVELPEPLVRFRIHAGSATGGNKLKLGAFVLEEWRAMTEIAAMLDESAPRRWLRRQRLRCIFAARSQVKINLHQANHPQYASEIGAVSRQIAGPICAPLGRMAVAIRDRRIAIFGRNPPSAKCDQSG